MDEKSQSLLGRAYLGGRVTEARAAVAEAAETMTAAFTVEQLAEKVRSSDPAIGLATVYRAVGLLVESGWLERVGERGDSSLYTRCEDGSHHHHIVCEGCGRTAHASCDLEATLQAAAGREGFRLTRHQVSVYGLCERCLRGMRD